MSTLGDRSPGVRLFFILFFIFKTFLKVKPISIHSPLTCCDLLAPPRGAGDLHVELRGRSPSCPDEPAGDEPPAPRPQ